jgi:hypothetical protein
LTALSYVVKYRSWDGRDLNPQSVRQNLLPK